MTFGMFDFYAREKPPSSTDLETAYRPYIETCIAAFGVNRSMFESNFPPDGATSSYPILWNAFKRLAAGSSAYDGVSLLVDPLSCRESPAYHQPGSYSGKLPT